MAEQKKAPKHVADENVDVMELEPVKQIEIETKNLVASSRVFIYTIIGKKVLEFLQEIINVHLAI